MCGRYTLTSSAGLVEAFELLRGEPVEHSEWWRPRFNVAPTQPAPIVTNHDGMRSLELARWGLLPPWSSSRSGAPLINARAERIGESRPFRDAIRLRRCLVPADGFFEWRRETATKKSPVWLHPEPRRLVAFAGVWERWRAPEGWLVSFAIVTTKPNALVAPIHDRMPVVLPPSAFARWLDPTQQDPARLRDVWEPIDVADWIATEVSPLVNKVAHDEPACIAPAVVAPQPVQGRLF
ncbi:MAG: SOS response-associated peptidase [Deltaproteobacteria bacterium]|nr:SOS response-associated peptidase [Deltaproteobacteria bacterium]